MDSTTLEALMVIGASIIALMSPFEAQTLRSRSRQHGRTLGWLRALWFGLCTTTAGVLTFLVVSIGIWFGVPYLFGSLWLPLLTAVPGLILGFLAARRVNKALIQRLLGAAWTGV
ncbi:MAG: hypothetical protein ACREP4_12855 [Stenotrophomonas sp.]|uniref:hypothetical protein n=1 Tax=Stenotrophomonas sp. TaxID=69392 RepID=UPI003D6D1FC6